MQLFSRQTGIAKVDGRCTKVEGFREECRQRLELVKIRLNPLFAENETRDWHLLRRVPRRQPEPLIEFNSNDLEAAFYYHRERSANEYQNRLTYGSRAKTIFLSSAGTSWYGRLSISIRSLQELSCDSEAFFRAWEFSIVCERIITEVNGEKQWHVGIVSARCTWLRYTATSAIHVQKLYFSRRFSIYRFAPLDGVMRCTVQIDI